MFLLPNLIKERDVYIVDYDDHKYDAVKNIYKVTNILDDIKKVR